MKQSSDTERFWSKVNKDGPVPSHAPNLGKCWVWTHSRNKNGYGRFGLAGKARRAHRCAWTFERGPIPNGLCVLHRCDNPWCVRPKHLFLGTMADNCRDRDAKGRHVAAWGDRNGARRCPERLARGARHWSWLHPEKRSRGERNGRAKLVESDVREIRELASRGVTEDTIAAQFHISSRQIRTILRRENWKHVA